MGKLTSAIFAVLFSMTLVSHAEESAPVEPAVPASTGQISKLVVTTGVQDRDPVDEITSNTSAEKVYCWVRAELDNAPTTIKHVWSLGGEVQGEITLNVGASSWRTWSSKNVWPGNWKVEVHSAEGTILASHEFSVTEASNTPSKPIETE